MCYNSHMRTVLLFRTSFCNQNRTEYNAIFEHARTHDWRIQTVEYMTAAVNFYHAATKSAQPDIDALLEMWHPDGCLIECGGSPSYPMRQAFRKVPVVFLDRHPSTIEKTAICLYSDSSAICQVAAKELLELGLDDFAFLKWFRPLTWSEERAKAFRLTIRQHGKRYHELTLPNPETPAAADELAKSLASLPKPCGLFVVNDIAAKQVIPACARANLNIPNDIAIVSVDNDEDICEHLPVTLTSIEPDFAAAGRRSAELLDQAMNGKRGIRSCMFGVKRIVRRASANGMRNADKRVSAATEFIRTHACDGIVPADVIKTMGCSESLANLRFRESRKTTILDEIHMRRIEIAKDQLLAKINSIETIAGICGYTSASDFSRVFKRYTGTSPLRWSKSQKGRH